MYVAHDAAGGAAHERDAALEIIQREMTAFARRARGIAAHMHPELSLVSFTLLSHVEYQPGCRATDLATHYLLDKSTISRQVSVLERAGLVARGVDPVDARVHVLHLTAHGVEVLAQVNEARRQAFRRRLADWGAADLDRFAEYLLRYNGAAGEAGDESGGESVPLVE
ncbi:MarR family winged helix-turn-helix transcriptional regulator [Streptomyces sp. NPDC088923]|uniref:MarR family winged helix-turn-helix transcriptional regulator n=1 Tax=Streptomyces sp. NPDC088923 TaxID=3365913 RepID=UPI00381070F0